MQAPSAPRRFPRAYLWPLVGLAIIGALWLLVIAALKVLAPISEAASGAVFLAYTFIVAPLLLFVAPLLVLIQVIILVYAWRQRPTASV